jgi:hypothetical protein
VLIFPAFLAYGRITTFFDLNARTALPAGVILVLLLAGLASTVAGKRSGVIVCLAALLAGVALFREIRLAAQPAAPAFDEVIARSERLHWLATQTSDRDLIAGIDTFDIPFYLGRSGVVCFLAMPYAENADYATLMAWVDRHRAQYERVFLVLPAYDIPVEQWHDRYGPFLTDLVAGRMDAYPRIRPHCRLADARVFEIR